MYNVHYSPSIQHAVPICHIAYRSQAERHRERPIFPKNAGSGLQMTDENGLDPSDQSRRIKRAALIKPVGHIVTRYAGLNSGYALLENLPMPPIRQENAHKSILLSPALVYCANMPKTPCLPTPPFPPSPSPSVSLSSPDAFRPTALSYSSKSLS